MNIVFVESLGMCECTINKSLATLKNQGHTVTFYHDRNENEEVFDRKSPKCRSCRSQQYSVAETFL